MLRRLGVSSGSTTPKPAPQMAGAIRNSNLESHQLDDGLTSINIAKMFEHCPGHKPTLPEVKQKPASLRSGLEYPPMPVGHLFKDIVSYLAPNKRLNLPKIPLDAIPGASSIHAIFRFILVDSFWRALLSVLHCYLTPVKHGIGRALILVSALARFWHVHCSGIFKYTNMCTFDEDVLIPVF